MARRSRTRPPQWFTWIMLAGGEEQTITWTDGVLSGDGWLIAEFLEGAEFPPMTLHPIPYSPSGDWRADPIVAQNILMRIGSFIRFETNIPAPDRVEGRIY